MQHVTRTVPKNIKMSNKVTVAIYCHCEAGASIMRATVFSVVSYKHASPVVELRKNQWGSTRRGAIGAEHRVAEGAEDRGAVGAENRGAEGAEGAEGGGAFLAHSGRYILQFSCLLYAVLR